jgi:hypothetical protein
MNRSADSAAFGVSGHGLARPRVFRKARSLCKRNYQTVRLCGACRRMSACVFSLEATIPCRASSVEVFAVGPLSRVATVRG